MAFDANKMRELMEEKQASKQQEEVTQQAEAGTTWTQDRMAELNTEIEDSAPEETYTFDPEESRQNFEGVGALVSNTFRDIARAETDYVMAEQRGDEEEIERARVNALRAPFKEGVRQFTAAYADDNQSRFQSFAQGLRQSSANIEYFMTDEEKLAKAREIGDALNVPPAALLASTENMQNAMNAYDYVKKLEAAGGSMEQAYTDFPKLKEIAQMDPQGAALALKDLHNIHEVRDIASGWSAFWKSGNDSYDYGVLKAKDAMEGLTEEEKQRVDELKKEMENAPVAPSFFVNPALAMLSGLQSLPEMIYSSANAVPYAVTGGVIGAAAVGAPTIGVGLPAGALAGFKKGFDVGLFIEMARPMMGRKYAEYQAMTDENGNRLMTDEQARERAIAETIPEALIEVGGFKMGVGKAALGEHAKKIVAEAMQGVTKPTMGKAALEFAGGAAKGIMETGFSEMAEEGGQSIVSDIMDADIARAKETGNMDFSLSGIGDTLGSANWNDIAKKAVAQSFEAAPGAFLLGGISSVGGAPMGGVRYGLESRAWNRQFGEMTKTERTTMTGTIMLEQLQTVVHDSKLQETAPDVQQEIIRDELKETPWQMAYVDVETALKNENGLADVREAGKAAGMTDEQIEQAIEEKGTIAVPLESYAQSAASPELLDSVSFSPDAEPLAKIRENAKKVEAEYTRRMTESIEKQINLTETMTKELFPEEGEERDAAMTAIYQNPENPAQGWKELYDKAVADRDEILAPALAALERGMGQGTSVVETMNEQGDVSTGRVSNSEEWYSKFYAEHKRKPNKEELREMASLMMTGDPNAPQVQGWTVSDKETAEMMANEKSRLAAADHEVQVLESIKERMQELNGTEMQLTAGMTPEAYKVYRTITTNLLQFGGKVGRAARVSALLWARHADAYAKRMQNRGHENYTAMNWLNDTIKGIEEGRNAQGEGYNQLRQGIDLDEEVNVLDFTQMKDSLRGKSPNDIIEYVKEICNNESIPTADFYALVGLPKTTYGQRHFVRNNSTRRNKNNQAARNKAISYFKDIISNAVVIEITPNKEHYTGENLSAAQKHKNAVQEYYRIMVPVKNGKNVQTLVLTAENINGKISVPPYEVSLYEINYAKKDKAHHQHLAANAMRGGNAPSKISIREMLEGVKDLEGNYYINPDGSGNYSEIILDSLNQFAGENAKTADTVKLAEAQRMEASGSSAEDIYKETGWIKGEDGKWRFEIPDNLDKINLDLLRIREHLPLGELYENEDLYEAYPFLRDVIVSEEDMPEGSIGRLDVANNIIFLNADMLAAGEGKLKESIVHEIQHIIQFHEKFAMGGNPADVRGQILSEIRRIKGNVDQNKDAQEKYIAYQEKTIQALNNPTPEKWEEMQLAAEAFAKTVEPKNRKRFERLMSRMNALQKEYDSEHDNYFLYARLGGEQEARKTADRAEEWTKKNREVEKASRALNEGMEKATKEQRDALVKRIELAFEIDGQPTDQQIALMEKYESEMGEELSALYDDYMWEHGELKEFEKDMPRPHNKAIIVFDGKELPYNQEMNGQDIQGRTVNYSDGKRFVYLFENADESTFLHESGHIFLMDLEKLAAMGDEESIADLKAVDDWASWHEGDAAKYKGTPWAKEFADREKYIKEAQKNGFAKMPDGTTKTLDQLLKEWKQERFARAFEIYLKEGKAPSKGLRNVFKKFCDFLKQVYVALVSDGARASAQVEAIMGRLIATDEEIEAAEQDERYKDFMQAGGEKLMYEDAAETFSRWHEEAKEEARDKLRKIVMRSLTGKMGRKRKEILREERERKEEELSNLPVYLARQAAKETGIKDAWKAYFPQGEKAWKEADKAAPPIEKALDDYMRKFEADLDKKEVRDVLKEETIEAAMSTARSHEKLLRMEQRLFARKAALANNLSVKTRTRLENVERWIDEMPDFIDESDLGTWNKAINSLKLSNRWTKEELDAIDNLSVSASKEAAKSNYEALRKIMKERKVGISDLREANKGRIDALRKQAKATIARQTLAQATQVQTHRREEKEAAKEAERLAKKEQWAEAAAAKERELLASFMASEAEKVRNRQDAILKHIRTQLNAKTKLPKDERYWHQHLAYLLRITDKDAAKPEGLKSLADIAKSLGEGLDVATDDDGRSDILGLMEKLTDENAYKDGYHGMKLSEFEDAADVLQVLYTTGKDKFNLKLTQGKTIGEAVEEILSDSTAYNGAEVARSTITGNPNRGGVFWSETLSRIPGVGDALSKYAQRYGLSLTKPEELVNLLGKRAHRYIYDTYDRAAEQEASMTADFCGKMEEILAKRYKPEEMREWQARKYQWQGQPVSKENILAMAMNLGNDINMDRLIMGMEANPAELQKFIADHMTEKDWLFCQDVWDLLQTYWPDTVRVEMELNGTRLKPQEARPFTVKTKDAKGNIKELDLRGGYYPIKYDPELSVKSREQSENAQAAAGMSGAVVLGMGRGFTKDRAAKGAVKQRPLLLDLSVIPEHVGEAIHNITTRIAARDVFRIVNDGALKEHITNTMGQDAYNVLQKWATDVWKIKPAEKNGAENLINGAIRRLRQNSGIAIMGYRMWPTIENATNIFPMMDALGAAETVSAMKDYYTNRREFDELIAKSLFMKERTERMDRDMKGQRGMFHRQNAVSEWLVKHAYDPITYTDLLCSKPLWARAYKNAFPEMLEEVRKENEENAATFEKRRAEYDAISATITDMKKRRADMQNELRRRNRREAPLMETDLTRMSRQTLQDEIYILDGEIEEKGKALFVAGEKMERASTLVIRTERETLEEAEHRAILAADKVVRDVIGSGDVKDLSEVQRSKNEAVKALTMFYSYFNTQANAIIAAHWKGKWKGGAKYDFTPIAKAIAYRFLLTAALSTAMRWLFFNEGNDDKDKYKKDKEGNKIEVPALERALKQYAKNALSTTVGGAYGLREVGNWAINRFIDGQTYGSGARFDGMYGNFVNQVLKEAELIMKKSERDEKAREEEEKRRERYNKMTPAQKKKFREEEKYRKPPNTISYADILRGAGSIGTSLTAGTLGVTEPIANAVLGTMQYIFDSDGRYDATLENMMWSAFWTKKPVKRTPPEKPEKPKKKGR